jgi:hypothetical protein
MIRYDHAGLAAPLEQSAQFPCHPLAGDRGVGDRRQTFPRYIVDDVQNAEAPATSKLIVHKVE